MKAQFGIRYIRHLIYDISIGEFALDENRRSLYYKPFGHDWGKQGNYSAYRLDYLAYKYGYLGFDDSPIQKEDRSRMASFDLKLIEEYGWQDVIVPLQIHRFQIEEATIRGDIFFLRTMCWLMGYYATHTVVNMESNGILVDKQYLILQQMEDAFFADGLKQIDKRMRKSKAIKKANMRLLEERGISTHKGLFDKVPWVFSFSSDQAKQLLYFEVLGLEALAESDNGGGRLNKAFQKAYSEVPEVQLLMEYNGLSKLYSTYIQGMYKQLVENDDSREDNRIRSNYNLYWVLTGRLSSTQPNLQNIPTRGANSGRIKRAFIAREGYILVKSDYSGHEVRGFGNVSGDRNIFKMFFKGLSLSRALRLSDNKKERARLKTKLQTDADPHKINYSHFFNVKPSDVTPEQRYNIRCTVWENSTVFGGRNQNDLVQGPIPHRYLIQSLQHR